MAQFTLKKAVLPAASVDLPNAAPVIMSTIPGVLEVSDGAAFEALPFPTKMFVWTHFITGHMLTFGKAAFKKMVKDTTTGSGKSIDANWLGFAD